MVVLPAADARPARGHPRDARAYRFVVFAQDHDQVGNRAMGDRLPATLAGHPHRDGLLRIAAGLVLTAPFTPMLFMGEEWGADTPWQFFTDHTDPFFAEAVSNGRRSEFARHGWEFAAVPDPQDKETFLRSKLDWSQPAGEPYRSLLGWYRSLLALRRSRPELTDPRLRPGAGLLRRGRAGGSSCTGERCASWPTSVLTRQRFPWPRAASAGRAEQSRSSPRARASPSPQMRSLFRGRSFGVVEIRGPASPPGKGAPRYFPAGAVAR